MTTPDTLNSFFGVWFGCGYTDGKASIHWGSIVAQMVSFLFQSAQVKPNLLLEEKLISRVHISSIPTFLTLAPRIKW